jgi:hypothetical protein
MTNNMIHTIALAAGIALVVTMWSQPEPPTFEARWDPVLTMTRTSLAACSWIEDCRGT